jgi:Flp pilus assembly protein TadD
MGQPAWYERFGRIGRRLSVAERYYERALYYYQKGKYDLAVADLDAAIQNEPKNAELYVARGLALLGENRVEDADDDFAYGLVLDPTQWLAYYGRGMRAFSAEQWGAAVDAFSRAQRLAPDRPEIYLYRAAALHRAGQTEEARSDTEYAQTLIPANDKRRKLVSRWLAAFGAPPG